MTTITIPAGPGEKEGAVRVVDLELIDNKRALDLVSRRHVEDKHPNLKGHYYDPNCQTCADISKRAYVISS